jgi:hypothetical protein
MSWTGNYFVNFMLTGARIFSGFGSSASRIWSITLTARLSGGCDCGCCLYFQTAKAAPAIQHSIMRFIGTKIPMRTLLSVEGITMFVTGAYTSVMDMFWVFGTRRSLIGNVLVEEGV